MHDNGGCALCEEIVCEAVRGLDVALALLAAIYRNGIGTEAFIATAPVREPSKYEFTE